MLTKKGAKKKPFPGVVETTSSNNTVELDFVHIYRDPHQIL